MMDPSSSQISHKDRLLLYCRLCGQRSISSCNKHLLRPVSIFAKVLKRLHGSDLDGEDFGQENADIYPKYVCSSCEGKLYSKDKDGRTMLRKIDSCFQNKTGDPEGLVKLAREMPLAEFWAHGAVGGCQICDDDDFFGDIKNTESLIRNVKTWREAKALAGANVKVEYSVPELPWFKQATLEHKSVKTKAQVVAELFRLMAKDKSCLALIGEIRAMGVSFRDPAPSNSGDGPIRENAKQVLMQIRSLGDSAKRAPSIIASILLEDKPDVFAASGITVDHSNALLKEKLTAKVEVEGVLKSPNKFVGRRLSGENKNGFENNDDDEIKVKKKRIGPASVTGRPSVMSSPAKPSKPVVKKRIPPDQLETLKRSFHSELPTDRFARTDIVRYLFHNADGQKITLLTRVGITFDYEAGSYVQGSAAFDEDRAMMFSDKLAHLIDVQWAVVLAEATFRLLDPKETRSLELAGIKVDADNPKTPLFYRLERAVKKEMMAAALGQTDGSNLAVKMAKQFNLNTSLTHVKAVESAFGVSNKEALKFLERGVRGTKGTTTGPINGAKKKPEFNIPSGISITPQKTSTPSGKSKLSPATKKRIIEGDADGGDDDEDWTPSKKSKRKCVSGKKISYDDDNDDDIVDLSD